MGFDIVFFICFEFVSFIFFLILAKHFLLNEQNNKINLIKQTKNGKVKPIIICSAAKNELGEIILSPRHYDLTFHNTVKMLPEDKKHLWKGSKVKQGFVDQFGCFYTREEAYSVATTNNQVVSLTGHENRRLYSENIY